MKLKSVANRGNVILHQRTRPGENAMTLKTKPAPDALLLEIAQRHFPNIETLETRNSDGLDFHDVAVWAIRSALEAAYEAGRIAGSKAMLAAATHR